MTTPTTHQFTKYQKLYDYLNKKLFKKELPPCLLILSRNTARVCGHFSMNRWQDDKGLTTHEINLNPVYMANATNIDICQTLVHEMVHLWQFEFGKKRSRMGYHNKEWGDKMESVGLMPSNTGKEGGKKTGQQMNDYPIKGGEFEKVFKAMPKGMLLPFKSKDFAIGFKPANKPPKGSKPTSSAAKPYRRNKAKYACPCGTNVWGKPELKILCGKCKGEFEEVG